MKNNFYFKEPFSNIYKLPNIHSEVTSQILYGERFKILSKRNGWIKIKSLYDRYSGFIKNKNYINKLKISHKVSNIGRKSRSDQRDNNNVHFDIEI